jgi:hypothetical protein
VQGLEEISSRPLTKSSDIHKYNKKLKKYSTSFHKSWLRKTDGILKLARGSKSSCGGMHNLWYSVHSVNKMGKRLFLKTI